MDLDVIILAKNESRHIARCLDRLAPLEPRKVFVVDCFSTDDTKTLAEARGATVVEHEWPGTQSVQFNWALDNLPLEADWILRLDADEYLDPDTIDEVKTLLPTLPDSVSALSLSLARVFLGKRLKFGQGKVILTRFFRRGVGRCEERKMDEHIVLSSGKTLELRGQFVDDSLMTLDEWTTKHVGYAHREAEMLISGTTNDACNLSEEAAAKRRLKGRYARLPLFWRSFIYFVYRYIFLGGFLDGKEGFLWAFLQAWWYRTYVDALIYEDAHHMAPLGQTKSGSVETLSEPMKFGNKSL